MLASDRVVRGRLERLEEVLVGWDQLDVDLGDRARVDQPEARVAGGRDHVVLATAAGRHQVEHVVRATRVLRGHLASRLLLERGNPLLFGVALPGDERQLSLAVPDRRRHSAALRHSHRRNRERHHHQPRQGCDDVSPFHLPSSSITLSTSGLHDNRTRCPSISWTSRDDVSRFCWITVSSPPASSATTNFVSGPT